MKKLRRSYEECFDGYENYYTYMAQKGLRVKCIGEFYNTFEITEPKKIKYQEYYSKKNLSSSKIQEFKDIGWNYIGRYGSVNVFESLDGSSLEFAEVDEVEQYKIGISNYKKTKIMLCILILYLIGVSVMLFSNKYPIMRLIEDVYIYCFCVVGLLPIIIMSFGKRNRWFNCKKYKVDKIKPRFNYKARKLMVVFEYIVIILNILLLVNIGIEITSRDTYAIAAINKTLPIIRLAEIENDEKLIPYTDYGLEKIYLNNFVDYRWTLLAPAIYEVTEKGLIKNKTFKDNSGTYSPSIHTTYYKLRFKFLAKGLLKELINKHVYKEDKLMKVKSNMFDELYVVGEWGVFARWGKNVIYIHYFGEKDIGELYEIIERKQKNK